MKVGYFILDKNGDLNGVKDTSKLDNAKWHQRLLARISKKYKNSLTMLVPIDSGFEVNSPDKWREEGIVYTCEVPITDDKGKKNGITENDTIDEEFIKKKMNESPDKRWTIK